LGYTKNIKKRLQLVEKIGASKTPTKKFYKCRKNNPTTNSKIQLINL